MLQKALKGDASGVKGKVGNSDIPKEALATITGLQAEANTTVAVDWLPGNKYEVDGINEMNTLELACVSGSVKLVQFLVEECNLRSYRDFQMTSKNGVLDAMQFIVVPILRKDKDVTKLLLDQSNLWSYDLF
jgi:hypothetical protein